MLDSVNICMECYSEKSGAV